MPWSQLSLLSPFSLFPPVRATRTLRPHLLSSLRRELRPSQRNRLSRIAHALFLFLCFFFLNFFIIIVILLFLFYFIYFLFFFGNIGIIVMRFAELMKFSFFFLHYVFIVIVIIISMDPMSYGLVIPMGKNDYMREIGRAHV